MQTDLVPVQPLEIVRQPVADITALLTLALTDDRVTPEKLAAMFDLQERIDKRQAEVEFNQAFARLMLKMPRVRKDGTIKMVKNGEDRGSIPFAKWEDVDAVIRPILAEEGFALSFTCEPSQNCVTMTGWLTHVMGHSRSSTMQLPPDTGPGRNALQAIGSSHSYGKRYIALDMLNIVTVGADDDGHGTGCITEDQVEQIRGLLAGGWLTPEREAAFLKFAGADSVALIQRYRFRELVVRLRRGKAQAALQAESQEGA
jgi:hypothetical protein